MNRTRSLARRPVRPIADPITTNIGWQGGTRTHIHLLNREAAYRWRTCQSAIWCSEVDLHHYRLGLQPSALLIGAIAALTSKNMMLKLVEHGRNRTSCPKDLDYSQAVDHPRLLTCSNMLLRFTKAGFTPPAPKSCFSTIEPTLLTLARPGSHEWSHNESRLQPGAATPLSKPKSILTTI